MTTTPLPDIGACADEAIRIPGAIQPHGWLIAVDAASSAVVAYSRNWQRLSGLDAGPAQTAALASVVDSVMTATRLDPAGIAAGESPASVGTVEVSGHALDITAHRSAGLLMLEFEPACVATGMQAPIYSLARHFMPGLQQASTVDELALLAVAEMKRLTGFGRCLAYAFDADGHGEVLAEEIDAGYDSYAAHRFPAIDIPEQARELYRLNHIRLIPDADYVPLPLYCVDPARDACSLDLSFAGLRSVSPYHLEYMRNMRTLASMSVSIVVRGRL